MTVSVCSGIVKGAEANGRRDGSGGGRGSEAGATQVAALEG